jgi:riboflavin synthase
MFSGIVEQVGQVQAIAAEGASRRLTIDTGFSDLSLGESVAINGVCLTVTDFDEIGRADFFVSPETLDRSNLGAVKANSLVNLERSVTLETRLSGHLVQGHVDGKARLASVSDDSEARRVEFSLPAALHGFCVEKGSIALNGISLTLNAVDEVAAGRFTVAITLIPHTWGHTNLNACAIGDDVNVEVDVLAKYVERLCQPYLKLQPA